jgi:hypothetical protein
MHDEQCTTMSMLVSNCHPARAGLQAALAETLFDYGAALDGPGSKWQSALMTALAFGYLSTAETLARRASGQHRHGGRTRSRRRRRAEHVDSRRGIGPVAWLSHHGELLDER